MELGGQLLNPDSGSSDDVSVELGGFEPPTSWVRSRKREAQKDCDLQVFR